MVLNWKAPTSLREPPLPGWMGRRGVSCLWTQHRRGLVGRSLVTVKAAFLSILSVACNKAQLQTWCFHSDRTRQATVSHAGGKSQSKLLKQTGDLLWPGKPRGVLTLDQPGSRGSHNVCRPGPLHLSTLPAFRLAPFANGLFPCVGKMTCGQEFEPKYRTWFSLVFLLNHMFILEIIFEARLARAQSGVNSI